MNATPPDTIDCLNCKQRLGTDAFLSGCRSHSIGVDVVLWQCPACGTTDPIQIENGAILLGYLGGAGVGHFSAMLRVPVPGLSIETEEGGLRIEWGERVWSVPSDGRPE